MSVPALGPTIASARRALATMFRAQGLDSPDLDARLLVGLALGLDHTALVAASEHALTPEDAGHITALAQRRLAGEPIARIRGSKEFWGLELRVSDAVLSPRPETETIVEAALACIEAMPTGRPLRIADLGTGSGAILLALLYELPNATGIGTDRSPAALAVARDNAARHGLDGRAHFVACDYGAALAGGYDVVVSNPPYIATGDIAGLAVDVRGYDPALALDGGLDGLAAYRAIAADAHRILRPGGTLIVEIGAGQGDGVTQLMRAGGLTLQGPIRPDLAGIPRVVVATV